MRSRIVDCDQIDNGPIRLIGGVDVSFAGGESTTACAALVVVEYPSLRMVYTDSEVVELTVPYISGYLAFREAPHILALIDRLRATRPSLVPQMIMVDGNGILHPRGFGLACHIGVMADIPTIGVSKKLTSMDGLSRDVVDTRSRDELKRGGDYFDLVGPTSNIVGCCIRSTNKSTKPIYTSTGHRVTLATARDLVRRCCVFRLPEPIRLADLHSRVCIKAGRY